MSAEQLYDSMLQSADRLDESPFGPADSFHVRQDGLVTPASTSQGWRRGIYLQQQRKVIVTHLENFDFPQMNPNCVERRDSIVAPQALYLMNNGMVQELASHFAQRVRKETTDPAKQIELVYWHAYSRPPSQEEITLGVDSLARLRARWIDLRPNQVKEASVQALVSYCHVILNSAEFVYID
jgi:hypothetical protein